MSPGSRRSLTRITVFLASAVVIPALQLLAQDLVLTWIGVAALGLVAVILFRRRRQLRGTFFLPVAYIAWLAAVRFRIEGGVDSAGFMIGAFAFLVLFMVGLLADAFWSPYSDDLEELEYASRFRD